MYRFLASFSLFTIIVASASAQTQILPGDLARLPEAIRTLPWRTIDLSTVPPLEYNRALLILNHVLDELSPLRISEADLMSSYIEQQNLGVDLATNAPPPPPPPLAYMDGVRISLAILRGPLAGSSYATDLTGVSLNTLAAYRQMYDRTCQRRWAEVFEATQQLRYMADYLEKKGKIRDYQVWAKVESENRQLKYEVEAAKKKGAEQAMQVQQAAAQQKSAAQLAQLQRENQQLEQALAAAQAQQQIGDAPPVPGVPTAPPQPSVYDGVWYAPTYYGINATWCRDTATASEARDATEARMAAWHGSAAGAFRR